jgi:2-polyprenyl-3-methyl-5-hydroxy-6-metoxy-1,4-benzoquinol methylase
MNHSVKFWDKLSLNYDKKAKDKTYSMIVNKCRKYVNPDDVVLDFACATGLYSFEFAAGVKEIVAFDSSSKMIEIAKRKAEDNKIGNILFSQSTLFDEQFRSDTFNIILALNILLYMDDLQKVTQRMRELLKPGGLVITSTACLGEKRSFAGIFISAVVFILSKLKVLPRLWFLKIETLEKAFTKEGFKIVEADMFSDSMATGYFAVMQKENIKNPNA